ncbi:MAG TPA: DUF58 domain-containing protein [Bryobacteraceae bacterium]|nr:DUF58 domain-containing protein [Bryobacteraceae bacterium]
MTPAAQSSALRAKGRLAFTFGPRFFPALLLGLIWLIPAWRDSRFVAAMFLWDGLVLLAWFVDLRHLPAATKLKARRVWSASLSLAEPAQVTLEMENTSAQPVDALLLDELPPVLRDFPPSLPAAVPAGAVTRVNYPILPRARGNTPAGRLYVRYRSPLGLAEKWAVADVAQTVRVLPGMTQARKFALFLIRSRQIEMEKRRRRERGHGRDFECLRDYRPGDELRDICWTATARRHHPIARTYRVERSQTVWIVVDSGRLLRTQVQLAGRPFPSSKLDFSVDAALSLAMVASQSGDRAGLIAYGRGVQSSVAPGRGALHMRSLVEALADVHVESAEADHAKAVRTLLRAQTRRSLIVWLTDFAETAITPEVVDYSLRLAARHLVVLAAIGQPDLNALAKSIPQSEDDMFRQAAALEVTQRRERLLRILRDRGVLAIDVPAAALAAALVNQYLEVKDRNLI